LVAIGDIPGAVMKTTSEDKGFRIFELLCYVPLHFSAAAGDPFAECF
jgi:hypothetical protein